MNTLEKGLWEQLRNNTKPFKIDWQRIESGSTGLGIPDVNGCLNGIEAWVELKMVRGKRILFEPMQVLWIKRRIATGGNVWVLAKKSYDQGCMLYLWHGSKAREIDANGIDCPADIEVFVNGKSDAWANIVGKIFLQ